MEHEQAPAAAQPARPISFLNFPQELRDMIYELLLVPTAPIVISPGRSNDPAKIKRFKGIADHGDKQHHPCLEKGSLHVLLLNKQISHEAAEILYKSVTFKFYRHYDVLKHFMDRIGPANRAHITKVHFTLKQVPKGPHRSSKIFSGDALRRLIESLPNLKSLQLGLAWPKVESFIKIIGAADARLGTLILHDAPRPPRGFPLMWMCYTTRVIYFLEDVVDSNIGSAADLSVKQKYLDLLELTHGLDCPPQRLLPRRRGA